MDESTPTTGENTAPVSAEVELGESVEIVLGDSRIEAFLSDNVYIFDPTSVHSRMAVRAYAYSLSAEDRDTAKGILKRVGREG